MENQPYLGRFLESETSHTYVDHASYTTSSAYIHPHATYKTYNDCTHHVISTYFMSLTCFTDSDSTHSVAPRLSCS